MASAKAWALRCQLELQQHKTAVFSTLTYSDATLPPTLDRTELQRYFKRLRKALGANRPLRFFACGEYGEQTNRPHYHAILYGPGVGDRDLIEEKWGLGHVRVEDVTPARIAYTAGYAAKKIGWVKESVREHVDPETGEVYKWQPPFIQMSRRPGIGGHARQWAASWRLHAVTNGATMPVPRFLHEAWKQQATEEEKELLAWEKSQLALRRDTSERALQAKEKIAIKKRELQAARRKL